MLRWQRKNVNVRNVRIWTTFIGLSCILHAVVLGLLLLMSYRYRTSDYTFTLRHMADAGPVVVVLRPVSSTSAHGVQKTSADTSKSVAVPAQCTQPAATTVRSVAVKPVARKKIVPKKQRKKVDTKKNKVQPRTEKKQLIKPPTKPVELAKPQERVSQKVAETVAPVPQQAAATAFEISPGMQVAYADARHMEQYMQLQQELAKQWAPPPGVADECACTLVAQVGASGVLDDIQIKEPSGVLMFDISARSALMAISWPRWAWASSVTITFKP